jgi:ribosomal protein S12 methylthiotransferase accessory factor
MKNFLKSLNIETKEKIKKFKNAYLFELNCPNLPFSAFGKGFSPQEAEKSAYGEMCERILTRNFFEDYYINNLYPDEKHGPFLNEELKNFYKIEELEKEDLVDFNSDSFEILSIPFTEKGTEKEILFPINLVQNLYASNGLAFHHSYEKAYYNAKTEIIERFVKFKVIKECLTLPKIDHPFNSGNVRIYDASLEGKYPVMAASFVKKEKIVLSFGCDLDRERAIEKAYLELLQTEFKNTGNLTDDEEAVKDAFNLEKHFVNLSGDVHKNFLKDSELKKASWNFKDLNLFDEKEYEKIYRYGNFYAVRLIIPGVSEIYPLDDLIYNNKNKGKFYRDEILNFQKHSKKKVLQTLEELNYFTSSLDAFVGVIFKEKTTPYEYKKYVLKNEKPEYSEKYLNLTTLSRKLNEI